VRKEVNMKMQDIHRKAEGLRKQVEKKLHLPKLGK
jgi:hypothetical protein